jgi:hypothetical protein
MTQNNLGNAYSDLPLGSRDDNLRRAIACYVAVLRVCTEAGFPADWATTQNNLGNAYWNLPSGNRDDNLRRAIACYEAALRVRTERHNPADWANTQFNLGLAHLGLAQLSNDVEQAGAAENYFEAAARGYARVGVSERADAARKRAAEAKQFVTEQVARE